MQDATRNCLLTFTLGTALPFVITSTAAAQSSSLFGAPDNRQALTIVDSWTYLQPDPPKQIRLHDPITVIVNESSQVVTEADLQRRKRTNADVLLKNWLELDGLSLKKAPQASGDPQATLNITNQTQAQADLETAAVIKFTLTAEVVDIRPNGNLVIEAHKKIRSNNEIWEQSLSGVIRPQDVLPNNTVLSDKIMELSIDKRETGHIRDAYKRGWFTRWLDTYKPF
jgi:flagellar L-ring protein precursor FlgH